MTVPIVHVCYSNTRRNCFNHLVVAEIDGDVTLIEDQIAALALTQWDVQEPGIAAHVVRVMAVPRIVPVSGRIVIVQIHAGRIERLHDKPGAVHTVAGLHGVIPNVSRAEIVVCSSDERVNNLVAIRIDTDSGRGGITECATGNTDIARAYLEEPAGILIADFSTAGD